MSLAKVSQIYEHMLKRKFCACVYDRERLYIIYYNREVNLLNFKKGILRFYLCSQLLFFGGLKSTY
jgi:hypothetical protein